MKLRAMLGIHVTLSVNKKIYQASQLLANVGQFRCVQRYVMNGISWDLGKPFLRSICYLSAKYDHLAT